jgi:hypothetical protein
MTQLMKHVGKYGEKPCVVIFRELPGEPEYCLIVRTDTLESRQHDDLMNVVQSPEAQQANEISEVLHRRQFTDGSNMLSGLHYSKKLQKVPVSHVSLTPTPSQSIGLDQVNAEINKINGGYVPPITDPASQQKRVTSADVVEQQPVGSPIDSDPAMANAASDDPVDTGAIADSLLVQAQLMEADAKQLLAEADAKKAEAYRLNPSLNKPAKTTRKTTKTK